MAEIGINSTLGSQLMQLLECDAIEPGSEPSYEICKLIYLFHPLAAKITDWPIEMAQSQPREIVVGDAPGDHAAKAFTEAWEQIGADNLILQTASLSRIYGASVIICGQDPKTTKKPLDLNKLAQGDIYFNVFDPLNVAGSLVLNLDPNSPDFLKKLGSITASGTQYHASRCCVLFNERPIYLSYTSSAYGYVGRSAFQRILYPLKTFIQTMITDDLVSVKAGVFIAKIKQPGSIANRIMNAGNQVKRLFIKESVVGNVISITPDDDIETLNMQNIDKAMITARTNALDNIASGAPMPAKIINSETFAEGFGEGTEDAKAVAQYIDGVRKNLRAVYAYMDRIVQRRAWDEAFFERMKNLFPEQYGSMDFEKFFYSLANSFTATWPNLLKEPPAKIAKQQKVQLEAIISMVQVLNPLMDPENKVRVIQWAVDNVNAWKELFPSNLEIDFEAMLDYAEEQAAQLSAQQEAALEPEADEPSPKGLNRSDSVALLAAE